ncbi:hypothetical protein ACRALDRAFT_206127 [Sodiomyces alcalophilus JCM 7366]|uniref:uncharacterized protein n=1 Tax=Sodiomyces alcalophilus JCM 7366 TaxID=591952 RepID=UPI0039B44159
MRSERKCSVVSYRLGKPGDQRRVVDCFMRTGVALLMEGENARTGVYHQANDTDARVFKRDEKPAESIKPGLKCVVVDKNTASPYASLISTVNFSRSLGQGQVWVEFFPSSCYRLSTIRRTPGISGFEVGLHAISPRTQTRRRKFRKFFQFNSLPPVMLPPWPVVVRCILLRSGDQYCVKFSFQNWTVDKFLLFIAGTNAEFRIYQARQLSPSCLGPLGLGESGKGRENVFWDMTTERRGADWSYIEQ